MQIFHLTFAWLLSCMALNASGTVDHEPDHSLSAGGQASSACSSPTALEATPLQRSHSTSPRCFGARGSRWKGAAKTKGDLVSAPPAAEDMKGHRRQRKSRPAGTASVSASSSTASTTSSPSSGEGLGFRTSHQPPCFGSKIPRGRGSNSNCTGERSPGRHEKAKGGGVGSYLREISRLLRRVNVEKSPPTTTTTPTVGTVRECSRPNTIASEKKIPSGVAMLDGSE